MKQEFKITKERILAMAEECPEAKAVLKRGFSEAFEDEWKDVTDECSFEIESNSMGHFLRVFHLGEKISVMKMHTEVKGGVLQVGFEHIAHDYKFVIGDGCSRNFHILKRQ